MKSLPSVAVCFSLLFACAPAYASRTIDLAGTWNLAYADGLHDAVYACPVPGDVQSALLASGAIPDPYYGRNEEKVQWVSRTEWEISRTFSADRALLASKSVILRLEDVDTFAEISLNGHLLGKTSNRFRRWEFDVKPYLKEGANELVGVFRNAEAEAERLAAASPRAFGMCNVTVKGMPYIRKPGCHGGWDWGITLMTVGFCGPVQLIATDDVRLDYLRAEPVFNDDYSHCDLTVTAETTSWDGKKGEVKKTFPIEKPELWWPNGMGEQKFFTYSITVGSDVVTRKVGLRKIEVVNTPDKDPKTGKDGLSFYLKVNGIPVFCKGADWIPCDALDARQTPEKYADLLGSAREANFNMIRVWGGGAYEKDAFYELCDKLGLLVWQDFMFACATYPWNDDFAAEVKAEAEHQVKRLRDHASIALWCGDNECTGALHWFDWEKGKDVVDDNIAKWSAKAKTIKGVIAAEDPARVFWPSSPAVGPDDYSAAGWKEDSCGDMHYWDVWHGNKSFDAYYSVRPRFCSEFGFQSYSSREVAETYCDGAKLALDDPDFAHHQKDGGGNVRIRNTMGRYFRDPAAIDDVLYLSQVQQAYAIRTAVESWRHQSPRCMGTLFWQMNDDWPVASWSSVEYGGKWKQLQYHAKRFYAPVAVVAVPGADDPTRTEVWAINDTAREVAGELETLRVPFAGAPETVEKLAVKIAPRSTGLVAVYRADRFGAAAKPFTTFAAFKLRVNGEVIASNERFFDYFKHLPLAKTKLAVSVAPAPAGKVAVTVKAEKSVFFVWLDAPGVRGTFDDDSFTLLAGETKRVLFTPKGRFDYEAFEKALTVKHLAETYPEKKEPVKIVFDTDVCTDYDDVGALAVLHAFADAGEAEILGVACSTKGVSGLVAVQRVNEWYGRPDIPLASFRGTGGVTGPKDHYGVLANWKGPFKYPVSDAAPDATALYRKILAAKDDGSVTICSVGFLSNLAALLESKGDDVSPLDGRALVEKKVKKLYLMACAYPKGKEYNSMKDPAASRIVLEKWPTEIVFSDFEYGKDVYTGRRIAEEGEEENPVADVYRRMLAPRGRVTETTWDRVKGHPSWDHTAVIAAVRGEYAYWITERGTFAMVGDDGENTWKGDFKGRHIRIAEQLPKREMEDLIDELMCRPARARQKK